MSPRPEDRRADTDMGGAELDGGFEIAAHMGYIACRLLRERSKGHAMVSVPTAAPPGAEAQLVRQVEAALRASCDAAEKLVADRLWPLPKYREMLFCY